MASPANPGRSALASALQGLPRFSSALRDCFAEGYDAPRLRRDAASALVVALIALPLSMALAIASGAPPAAGLATAIVAGVVAALAGGSRFNVTGPTAAFVVLLVPVAHHHGLGGLALASVMAGLLLVAMALTGMGRLIALIPHPVVAGFTAGIGTVIALLQVRDFLGLPIASQPESTPGKALALARALPEASLSDAATGILTMALLLLWPKLTRRVPAPLVALTAVAAGAFLLARVWPAFEVQTIASRFGAVPAEVPAFTLPWTLAGGDGAPLGLSLSLLRELAGPALAIGLLAALESLLCAVVADGLTGQRHDPDAELLGLGLANLAAGFFGGFAATGAIARTATNVRAGATSPLAAAMHSLALLGLLLLLAPALGALPMASLAALLLVVAWNMADLRHVVRTLRVAPHSDSFVLITCLALTVAFDMVVSVAVGVVLAALLFMRRMAEVSSVRLLGDDGEPSPHAELPRDVVVYEVAGPLFFGASERAMTLLRRLRTGVRAVVLDLTPVPVIDLTGLVSLESALARLAGDGRKVVLVGLQMQPRRTLLKAGLVGEGPLARPEAATVAEALILIGRPDEKER